MSNETKSDQKPAPAKDSLTRVPVRWVRFVENFDVAAGPQVSNLKGYAFPKGNPKWYSICFIPAWQQFEITLMNNDEPVMNDDTQPDLVPANRVYKWWRA